MIDGSVSLLAKLAMSGLRVHSDSCPSSQFLPPRALESRCALQAHSSSCHVRNLFLTTVIERKNVN